MSSAPVSRWHQAAGAARLVFWLALLALLLQMTCGPGRLGARRAQLLDRFQQERGSRVIAMIHGQETVSFFGEISDEMLILADVAPKARVQVVTFVAEVLLKHLPKEKAVALATVLSEGRWTHDFPITVEAAQQLGLPISPSMPPPIYQLMDLYPQAGTGRPSVTYVAFRRSAAEPGGRRPPATPGNAGRR